ncbi:MAG: hypothetical protein ACM3NT_05970 [Methylocystaceae bacterium]
MKRKSTFTLVVALMMLFAFTASCFAATATTTKKATPAKKVVKKVVKPAAKPAVKPAAKPAAKPAVKPTAPAATKAAAPSAVKAAAPAAAAGAAAGAAAAANPAGLTGDKAKAYDLLTKVKYSGKATGDFKADVKKIIIIGDKVMYVTTKSTGNKTLATSKDVPGIAGGDFKDKSEPKVPFIEYVSGDEKTITAILKAAKDVKVSGNTVTITGGDPPESILAILNSVSSKVKWTKSKLDMNIIVLKVGANAVNEVESFTVKGMADGTSDMPATVTGNVKY